MKNNIRGKISQFLKSEDGHVGAKSPLALGVASASLLLAQTMVTPPAQAHMGVYILGMGIVRRVNFAWFGVTSGV